MHTEWTLMAFVLRFESVNRRSVALRFIGYGWLKKVLTCCLLVPFWLEMKGESRNKRARNGHSAFCASFVFTDVLQQWHNYYVTIFFFNIFPVSVLSYVVVRITKNIVLHLHLLQLPYKIEISLPDLVCELNKCTNCTLFFIFSFEDIIQSINLENKVCQV